MNSQSKIFVGKDFANRVTELRTIARAMSFCVLVFFIREFPELTSSYWSYADFAVHVIAIIFTIRMNRVAWRFKI